MQAEVIAIGDELTTGQRLDTNSQWLSQRLSELGVEVAFHTTVGDDLDHNLAVLRAAFDRVDVVICTGGLGPTADDLTREALAAATGTSLVRDTQSLAYIEALFESRGREMPERNRVQADFPEGSKPIPNPQGTAPGIEMLVPRPGREPCAVFALPGVPAEMHEMWQTVVAPRIRALHPVPTVIRHRQIHCFGAGESRVEAMLGDLTRRGREPRVGITASQATITLRITASGETEATCLQAMEPTVITIRERLGDLVFGEGEERLEHVVARLLADRNETLAVAEWATAGLVAEWLAAVNQDGRPMVYSESIDNRDAFNVLLGKHSLPADIQACDAQVATAMAEAVRRKSGADFGLAVAAFPPDPLAVDARVCVALASEESTRQFQFNCASHPAILGPRTAKQMLNAVRLSLLHVE